MHRVYATDRIWGREMLDGDTGNRTRGRTTRSRLMMRRVIRGFFVVVLMSHCVRERCGRPFIGYPRGLSFTRSHEMCRGNECKILCTMRIKNVDLHLQQILNTLYLQQITQRGWYTPPHIEELDVDLKAVCVYVVGWRRFRLYLDLAGPQVGVVR